MIGSKLVNLNKWIFTVLTFVILFNYQNCAPGGAADGAIEGALPVDVINKIQTGGISFSVGRQFLNENDSEFQAIGFCEDEGSIMSWEMKTASSELIEKGKVECVNNEFKIHFEGAQEIPCDTELTLSAKLGAKSSAITIVQKLCD